MSDLHQRYKSSCYVTWQVRRPSHLDKTSQPSTARRLRCAIWETTAASTIDAPQQGQTCSVMPLPPIQLTHLEAVASATVVAKNLHIAASLTTGSPASIQGGLKECSGKPTCLFHARGVVHHRPRRLDLDGRLRVLKLHPLEVRNRLPKLHSARR